MWAFVIMPDHLHLIIDLHDLSTLGRIMNLIKGRSSWRLSHRAGVRVPVWQRGYQDHVIRNEKDLMIKLRYLLDNPWRAGLPDECRRPPYLWIREEWKDSVEGAP